MAAFAIGDRQALEQYVRQAAPRYGIDPDAALAVASREGLGGGVGDYGTSFGPWQLHIGGALPSQIGRRGPDYAQRWAWSSDGVNYALRGMASAGAAGLTGAQAVRAIVYGFERPADPASETAGAINALGGDAGAQAVQGWQAPARPGGGGGGGSAQDVGVFSGWSYPWQSSFWNPNDFWGKLWGDVSSTAGATLAIAKTLAFFANPKTWVRLFEGLIGIVLLMFGLYQLGQGGGPDISLGSLARGRHEPGELARGAGRGVSSLARGAAKRSPAGQARRIGKRVGFE